MEIPPVPKVHPSVFKKPQRSVGVEVILILVVTILTYIFLLRPKLSALGDAKNQYTALEGQSQSLDSDKRDLDTLISQMKGDSQNIAKLDEALPLSSKTVYVQILLNQLAQQTGVNVGDISVSPIGDAPVAGNRELLANYFGSKRTVKQIPASISAEGTVDQLQILLKKLETSARVIDINSVDVTAAKDNLLDFKITLTTYAYE